MTLNVTRVGDVCEQVRGVSYDGEEAIAVARAGYVPILRANNITDNGLALTELVFVPQDRVSTKQRIKKGDVVIATSSGSLSVVGKSASAEQDLAVGFGAFCKVLRPKDKVDERYFAHFFRTTDYRNRVAALAAGANIINLRNEHLDQLPFPLPNRAEQRRIAVILDQADALRTQRRKALAHLEELSTAVFLEMFAGDLDSPWPVGTIADAAMPEAGAIRTGPFGSQLLHGEFVDSGIAVLGIDNVVSNEFRWAEHRYITETKYERLKRYTVKPADVLITIMGTCGRCAVVPDDVPLAINTKHLCCITLDRTKVLPWYLHSYFLRHATARRYLEQRAKGAIMSGLNMGIIQAMPLVIPPLKIQAEFVSRLRSIESLKSSHRASLVHLDALFASLQHRAFRGEL